MLEIRDLFAGYGGKTVLSGTSMTAQAGRITAVIGPNGCGKSTLLKAVSGILKPAGGQVLLDGEPLSALEQKLLARRISYLAQSRQTPEISVERLVLHGRFPYLDYPRKYREQDRRAAQRAMEQMELTDLSRAALGELSGGQRQRAYIAMALAQNTDVILLDEPTTYLDVSHQLQTLKLARALAEEGKHVVLVLHALSQALETADSIALMDKGRVLLQGDAETVFASGCLDQVFGVRTSRVRVEGKWRYFCSSEP